MGESRQLSSNIFFEVKFLNFLDEKLTPISADDQLPNYYEN